MASVTVNTNPDLPRSPSFPTFFDNLDSFAEAPEGVAKLRELILDLAVRGKLVEQDENDEPASIILEEVDRDNEQAVYDGAAKKRKQLPAITSEEEPFELRPGWAWFRLDEIANQRFPISYGVLKPGAHDPDGVLLVKSQHIRDWKVAETIEERITPELDSQFKRTKIKGGEILLNLVGASIGRCAIAPSWLAGANVSRAVAVMTFSPRIDTPFLLIALSTTFSPENIAVWSSGSAQPVLNIGKIRQLVLGLPPLSEQRRIVSKVDSLMSLRDELESRNAERVRLRESQSQLLESSGDIQFARTSTPCVQDFVKIIHRPCSS